MLLSLGIKHCLSVSILSAPILWVPSSLFYCTPVISIVYIFYWSHFIPFCYCLFSLACCFLCPPITVSSLPSSSAKVTLPSFLLPSLLWLLMCFLSLCACRPSAVHTALLLQLSVSPSAFDSQASDELSSNQSMSFSPSNSAQPIPCFDSGPSPAHSSPGAARQVSLKGWRGCCP